MTGRWFRCGNSTLVGLVTGLAIAGSAQTARAAASSLVVCKKSFSGYEEPAFRSFEFRSDYAKKCLVTSRGRAAAFAPLTQSKDYRDISKMTAQQIQTDIRKRNGGLDPSNKYDLPVVQGYLLRKALGHLTEQEEKTLVRLNPKIASVMWSGHRGNEKAQLDFSPLTSETTADECKRRIRSITSVGWECNQLRY